MRNALNEFKLFRAIGLKEWGYHDEAFALMTEIVLQEVDNTSVQNIQKTKKDQRYVDAERYWDEYHYTRWASYPPAKLVKDSLAGPAQSDPPKGYSSGIS